MELLKPGWESELRDGLNNSADFAEGARWFDGSILLGIGEQTLWLKIYAGHVIDHKPHVSPFGFTFALKAPEETWRALIEERRNEILSYTGSRKILAEGNLLEFMRLTKTVCALVDGMRAVLGAGAQGKA
jgi:hypothetical protein